MHSRTGLGYVRVREAEVVETSLRVGGATLLNTFYKPLPQKHIAWLIVDGLG